jgi:hypothetical protein
MKDNSGSTLQMSVDGLLLNRQGRRRSSAALAAQGDHDATKNRDRAAGLITPVQIAEAQKLAREWTPKTRPQHCDFRVIGYASYPGLPWVLDYYQYGALFKVVTGAVQDLFVGREREWAKSSERFWWFG